MAYAWIWRKLPVHTAIQQLLHMASFYTTSSGEGEGEDSGGGEERVHNMNLANDIINRSSYTGQNGIALSLITSMLTHDIYNEK